MLSGQSFIPSVVVDRHKQPAETLTASNASLEYVCRFQVRTVTSVVHTTPIVETLTLGVLRAAAQIRWALRQSFGTQAAIFFNLVINTRVLIGSILTGPGGTLAAAKSTM